MKENNKLNKALKDALQGQPEPLHEAQWERLSAALGGKKSKMRFFPWFMIVAIVALGSLALGYWLGQDSSQNKVIVSQEVNSDQPDLTGSSRSHAENDINPKEQESAQDDQSKLNSSQSPVQGSIAESEEGEEHSEKTEDNNQQDQAGKDKQNPTFAGSSGSPNGKPSKHAGTGVDLGSSSGKHTTPDKVTPQDTNKLKKWNEHKYFSDVSELEFKLPPLQLMKLPVKKIKDTLPLLVDVQKNALKPQVPKKPGSPTIEQSRFALSLSSGLSNVAYKVARMENSEKLHKDAKSVIEQFNSGSRSYFGNLGFEWMISKQVPLVFSTGFQYRQISQDVNFNYDWKERPFREKDGTILFYVSDSVSLFPTFKYVGRNSMDFISLPLKVGYRFPIGKKNEFQLTGGLNLSMVTKAKGSFFSINEGQPEFKPLAESYKKTINVGLIGGFMYSRNIYKPWWLGVEALWQQNSLNYDAKYGMIKSRINVSNYNINLKYKF